jgi:hypothetical protein
MVQALKEYWPDTYHRTRWPSAIVPLLTKYSSRSAWEWSNADEPLNKYQSSHLRCRVIDSDSLEQQFYPIHEVSSILTMIMTFPQHGLHFRTHFVSKKSFCVLSVQRTLHTRRA